MFTKLNIMVKEIKTLTDFATAIGDKSTGLVVIDFWAEWCGPCKRIAPAYGELSKKYADASFYKINVDDASVAEAVAACEISAMPSFCLFSGGKFLEKVIGADMVKLEDAVVKNKAAKDDTNDKKD